MGLYCITQQTQPADKTHRNVSLQALTPGCLMTLENGSILFGKREKKKAHYMTGLGDGKVSIERQP